MAGLLRLGFVAQFLSRPVMEGFVFGLAIFVTVSRLPKLFGIENGSGDSRAAKLSASGDHAQTLSGKELIRAKGGRRPDLTMLARP